MSDDKSPEMTAIEALAKEVSLMRNSVDKAFDRGSKKMEGHDGRLRKVENRQSWFLGIGAAVAGVIAFVQRLPEKIWHFLSG